MGKLLAIAAKSPDVDAFADSMVSALSSTTLPETASLDEVKLLLEQVLRFLAIVFLESLWPYGICGMLWPKRWLLQGPNL